MDGPNTDRLLDRMTDPVTRSLELVRSAQQGDREALNRLLERYQERLARVVRVRLGPKLRSVVDSDDIVQETFLAAVQAFDRFEMRDDASLLNWLAKLAERQIIAAADYHTAKKRDVKRRVRLSTPSPDLPTRELGRQLASETKIPVEKISQAEQVELVETCLAELPEELRELIVWRDYLEAPWETVARETGRPSAAAARMMHARAIVELGKLLRQHGI